MKRAIEQTLLAWKESAHHKVLLVRGARQVGKTFSVRLLGRSFENIVEINFEENKEIHKFFNGSLSPDGIIEKLTAYFGITIISGRTLLFFDEVQSCKDCLRSLRFFYEKMPQLHVVAAGSLLEFALSEIPSFGVGRIESVFMYPLSFMEFLEAIGMGMLALVAYKGSAEDPVDPVLHHNLLEYLKTYLSIGGMPEIVECYRSSKDLRRCQILLDQILAGFRDDFGKYGLHSNVQRLSEVFESVALQSGGKFKYSNVSHGHSHYELKKAFDLLVKAGLVHQVFHTDARGIPPGAQINPRRFKAMLFDAGIHQRLMNLDLAAYLLQKETDLVNKGAIAEIFAGLEMMANHAPHIRPQLYYWHREARSSNAEVDYVIQQGNAIVPVEVKSGRRGAMQSMHLFLEERKLEQGIRMSLENFSAFSKIKTVPLYAAGSLAQK